MSRQNYYSHYSYQELHTSLTYYDGIERVAYDSVFANPTALLQTFSVAGNLNVYDYFIYSAWASSTNDINSLIKQSSTQAVFIGQVLAQINPDRIKAIVEKIMGESNAVAAVRFKQTESGANTAAFHLIFNDTSATIRFLAFNNCVLFDRYSFLIARTPDAARQMAEYTAWWGNISGFEKSRRQHHGVPRRTLVVERPFSHPVNSAGLFPPPYRSAALPPAYTSACQSLLGFGLNN